FLSFINEKERAKTSSSNYNQMLDDIDFDIRILYQILKEYNKDIINDFILLNNEKNRINKEVDSIINKVKKLNRIISNKNSSKFIYRDNFIDLKSIDTKHSTVDIDIDMATITLPKLKHGNIKHDISNNNIKITDKSTNINKLVNIKSLDNCLNDFENQSWVCNVLANNQNNIFVEIKVEFNNKITFNKLQLSSMSSGDIIVNFKYLDNNEWKNIDIKNDNILKENKAWLFNPIETKTLKIKLSKNKPDVEEDNTSIIGLKNIALFNTYYKNNGILISNEIELKNKISFNKVALKTEDKIHNSTSINYKLCFIDINDDKKYYTIEPNKEIINLNNITEKEIGFNNNNILSNFDYMNNPFYLYEIGLEQEPNFIKIYKGINMWKREIYRHNYLPTHKTGMNDWSNLPIEKHNNQVYKFDYIPSVVVDEEFETEKKQTNYKFTTYIYVNDNLNFTSNTLNVGQGDNNDKKNKFTALYINDQQVNENFINENEYNYQYIFNKGWNKIEYLFRNTRDNEFIDPFSNLFNNVIQYRSQKEPMKKVSIFDLKNNIDSINDNCYAIENKKIVMNSKQNNNYKANIKKYTNKYKKCILTAELSSDNSKISPELYSYEIVSYY
ncbi:MAG: hypothetical protein ACOCRK_11950, partial [bacterium]